MTVPTVERVSSLLFAAALAFAAIAVPAKAQSSERSKVDFDNGTLLYYDADCDGPHECTFAVVGCEDETPSISFSMDQKEVSAWFAKSNGRVRLKVGQVSIETWASEIVFSDMDGDWWPSIFTDNESEKLWGLLSPGATLEIVAGPTQLNLLIPKQIEDVRAHCKLQSE
jgi:predicted lipoprotein with Yx(FWY)xxD motif